VKLANSQRRREMGKPVVHFEVIGKDAEKLQSYYAELFGWKIDAGNPMKYGIVKGEDNPSSMGSIGGGVGWGGPDADQGWVTFYVGVPDVEEALQKAESLGGTRVMGPEKVMDTVELGQFKDPEGHLIGLVRDSS
jgi:predicted enzyme related to lactoylglutathione lyase